MPVADTGDHRAEQTGGAAARAQEEALTVGVTALMAPGRTMSGLGLLWGHLPHLDPWGTGQDAWRVTRPPWAVGQFGVAGRRWCLGL